MYAPWQIALIVGGAAVALGGNLALAGFVVYAARKTPPESVAASDTAPVTTVSPPETERTVPDVDEAIEDKASDKAPDKPSKGSSWFCTASGSARVCGFANACTNQMVFGNGVGSTQFAASQMAKNACEQSARIRGSSTVCVVSCRPR